MRGGGAGAGGLASPTDRTGWRWGLVRMNTRNVMGACGHGFSCRKSGRGNKREALNLVDSNGNLNVSKKTAIQTGKR